MFLKAHQRFKGGKRHVYNSLTESLRVSRKRVVQRTVLHLGELNTTQVERWQRTIEAVHEDGQRHQLRLFTDREGQAWAVRGILTEMFGGNISEGEEGEFTIGTNLDLLVTGHSEGDWYLVVHRNDTLEGLQRLTAIRLSDQERFDGATDSLGTPLTAESDYSLERMCGAVALGSSWHWNVGSNGLYDRLGLWSRSLTEEKTFCGARCRQAGR